MSIVQNYSSFQPNSHPSTLKLIYILLKPHPKPLTMATCDALATCVNPPPPTCVPSVLRVTNWCNAQHLDGGGGTARHQPRLCWDLGGKLRSNHGSNCAKLNLAPRPPTLRGEGWSIFFCSFGVYF